MRKIKKTKKTKKIETFNPASNLINIQTSELSHLPTLTTPSSPTPSLSPPPLSVLSPLPLPHPTPNTLSHPPMLSDSKVNVLLVDDNPENLVVLETILEGLDQNLVRANSGEEALRCLLSQDFAVILLDVQMPGMDGFETATLIRQRDRSRHTPIIFLTAFDASDSLQFKGYALGAVDYLLKPIDPVVLTSKVSVFVDLFVKTQEVRQKAAQLVAINAELRQSEERFRCLSACSPVGIFLADRERGCTYTNPHCQQICGFTLEESLGDGWIQFLHPDDRERAIATWLSYMVTGKQHEFIDEYRFCQKDGTVHWTSVRVSPMFSDEGKLVGHVGTIEDITERKQAEAVREQFIREQAARQQAEAANRMKDEFLAIVSHELRTPLNAVLGWSRLLLTRKPDEETTTRALETIERNAKAQAKLIEDILDISQIIQGKLKLVIQPVNLTTLINAVLESIRPVADAKSIYVETCLDPDSPQIFADADRLRQVFLNLLSNAVKFTPSDGRVEVRLQPAHLGVQIQVTDTGVGINPEFLPHVFDRFRQADSTISRPFGGLGLGLAIARHLVELHGGHILAESDGEGKGATFTIFLPQTAIASGQRDECFAQESVSASSYSASSANLNQVRVLVVEDNRDARDLIRIALEQSGAQVATVPSAGEAIEYLETNPSDVLISDIGLPGEDGYQLIQAVRRLDKRRKSPLPAIALTAHSRLEDQVRAIAAGFQSHVSKPVELAVLVAVVAELVGRDVVSNSN
jgi:PAS domain S-box-containing protein